MEGEPMTMNRSDTTATREARQWIAAEHRGAEAEAQAHLAALLSAQPAEHPSAGFADRVLFRLTEEAALVREGVEAGVPARQFRVPLEIVAAALFLFTGLALRLTPYWLSPILSRVSLPTWPSRLWQATLGIGEAMADLLAAVATSNRLSHLILTSPQGVAFVASCVAVAMLSARLLYGLLERSTDDV